MRALARHSICNIEPIVFVFCFEDDCTEDIEHLDFEVVLVQYLAYALRCHNNATTTSVYCHTLPLMASQRENSDVAYTNNLAGAHVSCEVHQTRLNR
mgnify:CR=1 FL=1